MRICLITSSPLPPEEGVGFYVWNLARKIAQRGHSVQIITRGIPGRTTRECIGNIIVWRVTFAPLYPLHVHIHGLFVNRLIAQLEEHIDVFHIHSPLPPVLHTQRPMLLTVHTPMRTDARGLSVHDFHSLFIKLQSPMSYNIERSLLRSAGQVVAVARSVAQELEEYSVDPAEVAVLGNGVDTTRFAPNGGEAAQPPYALAVGRLEQRKGFQDLVEAAQLVCRERPDVQFWIAGKGPMEDTLRRAIHKGDLEERVMLLGHIADREQTVKLYQGATLFVHAAHREGLPTVLLEAMACGRPVIATAVSGALDVVVSGENGLLVPPRAPAQMAEAVSRLLSDVPMRDRLGVAARRTIEARFSWDIVSDNYLELYGRLSAEGRSSAA
jgi:glycosyltransferase involved in cell wall biosynthesis